MGDVFDLGSAIFVPKPYARFQIPLKVKMCSYTYSWYYCNHDYYIWANSIEICASRLLSGYSYDAWSIDMCKNPTVKCGGFSNFYCSDCSEDVNLELQLDEW
ncbi:hypothetical protein BU25DRAFT_460262 [Macroventuria anomochaeta]|uniref:Uncharacterized protein n=1 Tax=Macroventuria anomochaeta TaxID=301207 RepID=A0ACB6RWM4_9PLEO|nr:uncharacterized protein BU25DRAFT_460262 [Macroventuria anomochaeta]KAF2625538.1 hypothetical protein BU25DRAFT_460262 [Macroventuria anomochaeta]